MSLVNEALKKARLEAARQDAARRGLPLPGATPAAAPRIAPAALFRAALAVAVIGIAIAIFFVGRRSSISPPDPVAATREATSVTPVRSPGEVVPPPASEPAAAADAARAEPAPPAPDEAPAAPQPRAVEERPPAPATTRAAQSRVTTAWEPRSTAPSDPPARAEPSAAAPERRVGIVAPEPRQRLPAQEAAPPVKTAVRQLDLPGSVRIELGGIAWSEERPFALINGRVVGPGDSVETLTVVAIEPRHVELRGQEGLYLLRLK